MRKIYFAGSIRGGRDDAQLYKQIISFMASLDGWSVLTEHIGLKSLTSQGEYQMPRAIHDRDLKWVQEADIIVAEVTHPSLGVGYELAKAEEWGKPILALHRFSPERRLSAMIAGSPQVHVVEYQKLTQAQEAIVAFLAEA